MAGGRPRPLTGGAEKPRSLRDAASQLRVLVPPVWPVKVRRVPLEEQFGDCSFIRQSKEGPYFLIRVAKSLDPDSALLILIHEWAHCLSWGSVSHRIRHHGPEWGIAMSRIWQALLED